MYGKEIFVLMLALFAAYAVAIVHFKKSARVPIVAGIAFLALMCAAVMLDSLDWGNGFASIAYCFFAAGVFAQVGKAWRYGNEASG